MLQAMRQGRRQLFKLLEIMAMRSLTQCLRDIALLILYELLATIQTMCWPDTLPEPIRKPFVLRSHDDSFPLYCSTQGNLGVIQRVISSSACSKSTQRPAMCLSVSGC